MKREFGGMNPGFNNHLLSEEMCPRKMGRIVVGEDLRVDDEDEG